MYVNVYICTYVCMYVCTYEHTHIFKHVAASEIVQNNPNCMRWSEIIRNCQSFSELVEM